MKSKFTTLAIAAFSALAATSSHGALIITGIIDGPRTGGTPKAIELFATSAIPDLSIYSIDNANNGGAFDGTTIALSGSAAAGQYIYVASEAVEFTAYFGFSPNFTGSSVNVNGNDVVGLFLNSVLFDVYGVQGVDGTGQVWDYLDGFAYRSNGSEPTATFTPSQWTFSGANALDIQGAAGVNGDDSVTVQFGTYAIPEPSTALLGGLGVLALLRRRR